jgi:hypothetical protein
MTVTVTDVCVSKPKDRSPPLEVALPVAWPDTVIGIRKLPVKAARAAGDVKTSVCADELLVTGAKSWPLVPLSSRLPSYAAASKLSVTAGMVTEIAPDGTLIDRFPVVVPVTVLLELPRFSAWNPVVNDPEVTTSTSVKVPIVELKYKNAWVATLGSDSRFGKVADCVIVAVADPDRSRRSSRV